MFSQIKKLAKKCVNTILRSVGYEIRSVYSSGYTFRDSFSLLKTVLEQRSYSVLDVGVADGTPELYRAFPSSKHAYLLIEANPTFKETVQALGEQMNAKVEY